MKIGKIYFPAIFMVFSLAVGGCSSFSQQSESETEMQTETGEQMESETFQTDSSFIYGSELMDGVYPIQVDSSSNMFRITQCQLTVENGKMTAFMTMGGTGYLYVFMGTKEEALKASETEYIPYIEQEDGSHAFSVPVEALDMEISCSAFSKRKETWYDRTLVFRSDSLPAEAFADGSLQTAETLGLEDGNYQAEVTLEGGSGRAVIQSPADVKVENGKAYGTIRWDSSNYDYMRIGEEKFFPLDGEENSVFQIPIEAFDRPLSVAADTVAMSTPHEIQYTLTFHSDTLEKTEEKEAASAGTMNLQYADQFSIEYLETGSALVTIKDGGCFLVLEEGEDIPSSLPEDVAVIQKPLKNIYLAATSAMDLFCGLDSLDRIALSGTEASGWYIEEARKAMETGNIAYGGKYNAPDYELILSMDCDLAIESTMIYHSPEVKEQLERLGIPVLVERSSYESHPLGRLEWIKLYGLLLDKEEEAEACFEEQAEKAEQVMGQENTGKTAAFFYISSNGYANVRKPGDYVAEMIRLAGGNYVPEDIDESDSALSTLNMQMEAFYAAAKDTDYLIYNSAIDGELEYIDQLLEKAEILADFKAVQEGNVWCTGKNMFQETMGAGDMIEDIRRILTEEEPDPSEMVYIHKLKNR